jgi:hypothetical protein
MLNQKSFYWATAILSVLSIALTLETAEAQRRFQIGGPFGIGVGGGRGLTIGGGYGVQLGGGQGLRFGPPNAGVQYGGGQLLRYGTPNAGVRIGGGEGLRLGTPQSGLQLGNGNGIQVGRFPYPNRPAPIVQPIIPVQQVPMMYGQPVYPAQINPSAQGFQQFPGQGFQQFPGQGFQQVPVQGFQQVPAQPNGVSQLQAIPPSTISNVPTTTAVPNFVPVPPAQNFVPQNVVPQTQFDAARQPANPTPVETVKPAVQPAEQTTPAEGISVLKRD